jgi:hypothetical protein
MPRAILGRERRISRLGWNLDIPGSTHDGPHRAFPQKARARFGPARRRKKFNLEAGTGHQTVVEGETVMKNWIVPIGLLTCIFFCHLNVMRAQTPAKPLTSAAPVLPVDVKFRYVPQYFEQSFADDPRYSRIEALVDDGRCDVILLDKTTNREVFYSTANRKVEALAEIGADAYTTPIDFSASSTIDSYPLFLIHFHDQFGQEITWQFVVGGMVAHASPEVISQTDSSSLTLLYAPRRGAGVAGTALTIAGKTYQPQSTQSNDELAAFYATDMTVGQILPGTDLWNVESGPADGSQTGKWDLAGEGGRQRALELKQLSDTEAAIEQIDLNDPGAPQVVLNLERVNDIYELRSLSFLSHNNRLWIFFGPALPLPAHDVDDKTAVTFTVAENEQANVASGELEVQRAGDAEHVLWRFDTPILARSTTFETGVNLIFRGGEQATCVNVPHETPGCLEP